MVVKFHVLQRNDETGETRHEPLFTQEWGMIRCGQHIAMAGVIYRVDSTEWIDMKAGILNAYCLVFRDETNNFETDINLNQEL